MTTKLFAPAAASLFLLAFGGGCIDDALTDASADSLGEVEAAIENAPSGVQCIRLTAAGATTKQKLFSVETESLSWRLEPGEYALSGEAFDVPCPTSGTQVGADATWIADGVDVEVHEGSHAKAQLHFYQLSSTETGVDFQPTVMSIDRGGRATYAVLDDGRVMFWGALGSGTAPLRMSTTPVQLAGFTNIASTAAGDRHVCALDVSGIVRCVGENSTLQLGSYGPSTLQPREVALPEPAISITAGNSITCAVTVQRSLYCWGRYSPPSLWATNVASASATTDYVVYLDATGQLQFWDNEGGELTGLVEVYGGFDSWCARRANGTFACKDNYPGSPGELSGIAEVPALAGMTMTDLGYGYGCASNGEHVTCWSSSGGRAGELGDGTGMGNSQGVVVPGLTDVSQLAIAPAFEPTTCALRENSEVYCWGDNSAGQVGDGTKLNRFVPTRVLF